MTLAWVRGQLRFEDVEYPAAVEAKGHFLMENSLDEPQNGAVTCP